MYKLRKIFALFLAIVLATSFSTVAFAAEEETGIPENATKHTVELTVEPGENIEESTDEIAPYIWNQISHNTPATGVAYTPSFIIPDRYFAYEISAIGSNGSSVPGTCTVQLMLDASTPIASTYVNVDGSTEKLDWIDVNAGFSHLFKIMNGTSTNITVTITYYSWA